MAYSWDDKYDYESKAAGFDFHDAKKSYLDEKRTYATVAVAREMGKAIYTYKSPFLKTDSPYPVVIGIDTTASMQEWPEVFFNKLPLLYQEAVKYLPGCALSFQAINDFYADGEDNALQPAPFGIGSSLDKYIGELYPAGGGGGKQTESYEIFAAYNTFIECPKAKIKPLVIILGDETPFAELPSKVAQYYKIGAGTRDVFGQLAKRSELFLVRKPYYGPGKDDALLDVWRQLTPIPAERIINLEDPKRVVDAILGIIGIITGNAAAFEAELVTRQNSGQVKEVLASLAPLKKTYEGSVTQHSISANIKDTQKTKGLDIDE